MLKFDEQVPVGTLKTVNQFVDCNPAFTMGGMRQLIFHKGSEAEQAGAIVRFGRKILIDEAAFIAWVKAGGTKVICTGDKK